MALTKKRRLSYGVLLALVFWQVVPMITSRIGPIAHANESVASLSSTDQKRFESLVHPTEDEIREASANIENVVSTHLAAMSIWREAISKLFAGVPTEAVVSDLGPKLPHAPPGLEQHYGLSAGWLSSDFWRRDRKEILVTALDYGYRDAVVMNELKGRLADKSTYSTSQVDAYVFALVQERRFDEAVEMMSARVKADSSPSEDEKRAVEDLKRLRAHPDDLKSNLAIAEGLLSFDAGTETFLEFCYGLWPRAKTPEEKARILQISLSAFSHRGNRESSLFLCENAIRLTAGAAESHGDSWPSLLGTVAEFDAQDGSKDLARQLYKYLAQTFPSNRNWGVSQYNFALLLEQTGYPMQAEIAAKKLIDSDVNDQDSSPNLTQTYQNYRHESALLISDARSSMGDFDGALRWRHLAITKYKFQSWCGTCSYLEAGHISASLFWGSLWAGPIYVVRYFTVYPENLLVFSPLAILALIVVFWRRRKNRRKMAMPEQ